MVLVMKVCNVIQGRGKKLRFGLQGWFDFDGGRHNRFRHRSSYRRWPELSEVDLEVQGLSTYFVEVGCRFCEH